MYNGIHQNKILRIMFGDLKGSRLRNRRNSSEQPSLSRLLVQLPTTWNGSLNGIATPTCWRQSLDMYMEMDMIKPRRYRICTRSKESPHTPEIFLPSLELNSCAQEMNTLILNSFIKFILSCLLLEIYTKLPLWNR